MQFQWDDAKIEACFVERGFDFEYAAQVFFDPHRLVTADTRRAYREDRFQVLLKIEGRVLVVVYTPRARLVRIISARKANDREVLIYERHAQNP